MKNIRIAASLIAAAALAAAGLAQAQTPPAPATPQGGPFSFFITSTGNGQGANLGGLAGADAQCQKLAAAVGAGNKVWHAYLSTQAEGAQGAVNARDRIGAGPWYNVKGALVARSLSHLHSDTVDEGRIGNAINWTTALTEKGDVVKHTGDTPNEHDILTGSLPDGRAFPTDGQDHTCKNYTSATDGAGAVQLGHLDKTGRVPSAGSWNSAHGSRGCSQPNLVSTGGAGLLYCFAVQ